MFNFMNSYWYFIFIFFIIMPINGFIMAEDSILLGAILSLLHVPYVLFYILPKFNRD